MLEVEPFLLSSVLHKKNHTVHQWSLVQLFHPYSPVSYKILSEVVNHPHKYSLHTHRLEQGFVLPHDSQPMHSLRVHYLQQSGQENMLQEHSQIVVV
mgnify:CR=1 FL=1